MVDKESFIKVVKKFFIHKSSFLNYFEIIKLRDRKTINRFSTAVDFYKSAPWIMNEENFEPIWIWVFEQYAKQSLYIIANKNVNATFNSAEGASRKKSYDFFKIDL